MSGTHSNFQLGALPPLQCYDCRGCGECCRGYLAISVTEEERDRIQGQGWERDTDLQGQSLFVQQGKQLLLAHRLDGCCVFLDEENRCRIHAKFGEAAKPLICRLYPFNFVPAGNEVRADIRFDCPAVADNDGRPLAAHRGALGVLLPLVVPAGAREFPVPPLLDGVMLDWPRIQRITGAFDALLQVKKLDITRRMVCCVNLAAALANPRLRDLEAKQLDELLAKASAKVIEAATTDTMPRVPSTRSTHAMFRQLLTVYGRRDRIHEKPKLLQRLFASLAMIKGRGSVPSMRDDLPAAEFAALDESFGTPTGEAAATLLRYYRVRLASMSFCGRAFYGRSYLDGLNALLLTYPLILWFARIFAMADGATTLDRTHIERALAIVDHQHGHTPLLNVGAERYRQRSLCERSHLRSLVVWYGV